MGTLSPEKVVQDHIACEHQGKNKGLSYKIPQLFPLSSGLVSSPHTPAPTPPPPTTGCFNPITSLEIAFKKRLFQVSRPAFSRFPTHSWATSEPFPLCAKVGSDDVLSDFHDKEPIWRPWRSTNVPRQGHFSRTTTPRPLRPGKNFGEFQN